MVDGVPVRPNVDDVEQHAAPGHVPRMQEQDARPVMSPTEKFKKQNKYELLKLSCFAAACLTCCFALPLVNKGCEF